jgi:hypothetical protein
MLAKTLSSAEYGREYGLRPGTRTRRLPIVFGFNQGGMGDFVNYAGATTWVAQNCPWDEIYIMAPRYLNELLKLIHSSFDNVNVIASEEAKAFFDQNDGITIRCPNLVIKGAMTNQQFLTCLGAHPFDVGFAYYANLTPPPADAMLPMLDLPKESLPAELQNKRYVVIPVGNQAPARKTTGKHLNPIIDHIKGKGMLPVFLGKADLLDNGKITSTFAGDIYYKRGLDLRDKTSVVEAATIMQHAVCTVGLDSGLLHVAALMKDSKIIFGYNITTVAHREPRRNWGYTINLNVTETDIECAACQSRLRNFPIHQFDQCLYGDTRCIDILFRDDSVLWRDAIDRMSEINNLGKV